MQCNDIIDKPILQRNKLKQEDNSFYDTNRINMAINNQFRSNTNFLTTNNENSEIESGELLKVN